MLVGVATASLIIIHEIGIIHASYIDHADIYDVW